jgi:hypothetical protein
MGMTTLQHCSGGAPPGEEVGVLFGFGRRSGPPIGVEFGKGWTYQAPYAPAKLAQQRQAGKQDSPGLYWPMIGSDGSPWALEREEQQVPVMEDARLNEFLHVPEYIVEDTQIPFDVLLDSLTVKEALFDSDLEPILQVLDMMVKEAGGHNLTRLIETLGPYTISQRTWRRLASIIKAQIIHRNISRDELLTIFKLTLDRTKDWELVSFLFANRVAATNAKDCLLEVLRYIVTSDQHRAKTKTWLLCVRSQHKSIRNGDVLSPSWRRFYGLLAEHFQPSDSHVVHHFGWLKKSELARVLLECYIPGWISQAEGTAQFRDIGPATTGEAVAKETEASQTDPLPVVVEPFTTHLQTTTIDHASTKVIHRSPAASHTEAVGAVSDPQKEAPRARAYEGRLKYLKTQSNRLLGSQENSSRDDGVNAHTFAIVDLVDRLARYQIPYTRLLAEVADIYMETQRNTTTKNFFMELRRRRYCGIPTALAAKLVHHFVAHNEINFAFDVFRSVPTLPLLPYTELLLRLIQQGKTHGAYIFEMLTRFHPEERIPEQRRMHRRLSIKQEHIDLVHEVAYVFASSEHLSPRTAFRRVWECYRFLRDRRAPLRPLISRAFVKAGITRPLKESERLSEEQVKYIISIVHQVEGPAIAKEVDHIVWDAWKWTLERQWSRNSAPPAKGPEGQGQLYENRRRLWMKGGGRIYVPDQAHEHVNEEAKSPRIQGNQEGGATDNAESTTADGDSSSSQLTKYEPTTILSSLTEMNEVLGVSSLGSPTIETHPRRTSQHTEVKMLNVSASEMDKTADASCGESQIAIRYVPHETY